MIMKPRSVSGEEPPKAVAKAMKNFDVILCPTTNSLTHTNAKIKAVEAGARLGSMPNISKDMFEKGAITANYDEVEALTFKFTKLLNKAKKARIVKDGYTLEMRLDGREGIPSTGIYKNLGESGNLPSGEAYIAPLEDSANGEIIVDGSMVGIGKLKDPLYIKIEDGKIAELMGKDSEKIGILFDNDRNRTVGELGIGTNHAARLKCSYLILEQ